jgi:hypothetical protein
VRELSRKYHRADVSAVHPVRKPDAVRRLICQAASRTAQERNAWRLAKDLAVKYETVSDYLDALTRLGIVLRLGAWSSAKAKREVKSPKLHLMDTGLATALRGEDSDSFGIDADPTAFGSLFETFVFHRTRENPAVSVRTLVAAALACRRSRDRYSCGSTWSPDRALRNEGVVADRRQGLSAHRLVSVRRARQGLPWRRICRVPWRAPAIFRSGKDRPARINAVVLPRSIAIVSLAQERRSKSAPFAGNRRWSSCSKCDCARSAQVRKRRRSPVVRRRRWAARDWRNKVPRNAPRSSHSRHPRSTDRDPHSDIVMGRFTSRSY